MRLSKRLNAIASLITNDDYVADIGCDHAYLSIFLIENKIISRIVATEVAKGPYETAKSNIIKYNLQDHISLYLTDGLDNVNEDINTIVIAGMGSKTIINILSKYKNLKKIKKMIIQTNNDYFLLRSYLYNNGFYIKNEYYIYDQSKDYLLFEIYKGNKTVSEEELIVGKYNLNNLRWYEIQINKYKKILSCIDNHDSMDYQKNKKILDIYLTYFNKKR